MDSKGRYNESEMKQKVCMMVRAARVSKHPKESGISAPVVASMNREVSLDGHKETAETEPGQVFTWNKCSGSACAHWRWHRKLFGKIEHGGLGYCGLAGK